MTTFWQRSVDLTETNKGNTPQWSTLAEQAELMGRLVEKFIEEGLHVGSAVCIANALLDCADQDEITKLLETRA